MLNFLDVIVLALSFSSLYWDFWACKITKNKQACQENLAPMLGFCFYLIYNFEFQPTTTIFATEIHFNDGPKIPLRII